MIYNLWFSQKILCCRKGVCVLVCKCHGHMESEDNICGWCAGHMEVRGQFLGVYLHHLFLRQGLSCLLLHCGLQAIWPVSFWMVLGSLLPSFLRSAHHFGLSVVSGLNMGHQTGKWFCHLNHPQARLQRLHFICDTPISLSSAGALKKCQSLFILI